MIERIYGWQAVEKYEGVPLSITGVIIVFTTLALISLFIAALPHILKIVNKYFPENEHGHGVAKKAKKAKKAVTPKAQAVKANNTPAVKSEVAKPVASTIDDNESIAVAIAASFDAKRG
jgi:Na+-transporting methylmalonyl-CoA/oxaloacetate decarboxylase gamma subunit